LVLDIAFRSHSEYRVVLGEEVINIERNLDEILEQAAYERLQDVLGALRENNPALQAADEEMVRLSGELIQDPTLPESTRDKMERYLDQLHLVQGHQQKYLYAQGIKDCVHILRKLGIHT